MRCPKTYRYVVSYCTGYIFASKVSKANGMDGNVSLDTRTVSLSS